MGIIGIGAIILTAPVGQAQTPPTPVAAGDVEKKFRAAMAETDPLQRNMQMMQLAVAIDEPTARTVLDSTTSNPDPKMMMLRVLLISRLSSLNPTLGVDYALKVPGDDLGPRSVAISAAFNAWASKEPEKAIEYISKMPRGKSRQHAVAVAVQTALKADPVKATQLARALLTEDDLRDIAHLLSYANAENDSRKAAEDALKNQGPDARDNALYAALKVWTQKDRPAAMTWAQCLPKDNDRKRAMNLIVGFWSETDPPAAARFALNLSESDDSALLIHTIVSNWSKLDRPAAAAWIKAQPEGRFRLSAVEALLDDWSRTDVKAALAFAQSVGDSSLTFNALMRVLAPLVKSDLPAALDWLQKMPPGKSQDWAIRTVATEWAQQDPRAAAEFAKKNGSEDAILNTMSVIAEAWIKKNYNEAFAYMEALPPGEARNGMLSSILTQWMKTDPKAAIAYMEALSVDNRRGSAYLLAIDIAMVDPKAAAQWATTLPLYSSRMRALDAVLNQWNLTDPNGAAQWLGAREKGWERDNLTREFAKKIADQDPASAMKWASSIEDTDLRKISQFEVLQTWVRLDAATARAWLKTSDLPQETKDKFLAN